MKRSHILAAVMAAHLIPAAAWALVKPLRVVSPELAGLTCTPDRICIDDLSRVDEARSLLNDAASYVGAELGPLRKRPTAVFCSTENCASKFGLGRSVAFSVGTMGIIISDKAWHAHFVRHELIHHKQNEQLGVIHAWLFKPAWLIEGMAYSRSRDPRRPLPALLEPWRARYEQWEQSIPSSTTFWSAAEQVE
jgi:hypothetical protein